MNCPNCLQSNQAKVIDSRPADGVIRRRRECFVCGTRWTTYEVNSERLDALAKGGNQALIDSMVEYLALGVHKFTQAADLNSIKGPVHPRGRFDVRRLPEVVAHPVPVDLGEGI